MSTKTTKQYATSTVAAMCVAVVFAAGIAWNTFPLFASPIIEEFGCLRTEFTIGITLVNVVNGIFSMFFYGRVTDKLGMRKYMVLCVIVSIAAFLCFALAQNVYFIWLGGALFGFGSAGLSINTVNVIVDRWFMKNQGKFISIPNTVSAIAGIACTTIWSLLIAALGWRIPFWIIIACGVVAIFLILWLYKGDPKDLGVAPMYADEITTEDDGEKSFMDDEGGISYKDMFKTANFWVLAVAYFGSGLMAFCIMSNLALFATDFGYGDQAGIILSAALIAQTVSFLIAGPIMDKAGSKWCVAVYAAVIAAAAAIFMLPSISLVLMFVAAALVGYTSGAAQMPMGASVREAFGRKEFSKKMGTVTSFTLFGFAFGPSILNIFYDTAGTYHTGLVCIIGLAVVVVVLMFIGTRPVTTVEE